MPLKTNHRAGAPRAELWAKADVAEIVLQVDLIGDGLVRFQESLVEDVWPAVDFSVVIPRHFVSDGYSIPNLVWLLVGHPFGQRHMMPAFVHDYLCDTAKTYEQRVLADAVFFVLLKKYQVPAWKQAAFYIGVRCCGRYVWKWTNRNRGGSDA